MLRLLLTRKHVFIITLSIAFCHVQAQERTYWKRASEPASDKRITTAGVQAADHEVFTLDLSGLKAELEQAPDRQNSSGRLADLVITFPNGEGNLERFKVVEASVLHPTLSARYPGIKSYAGQSLDDPTATIRFSVSDQQGFHGMVLSGTNSTLYIDPYTLDLTAYIVYERSDVTQERSAFQCMTANASRPSGAGRERVDGRTNDKKLRKYRLALSCTAEYGNLFAGSGTDAQKKANILARMNTTMTRVNGIYERDLAITMEIIPNNDLIIFYGNTSADPWTNEYNDKTQQVNDNIIGSAHYDIGHNFNTTGGGNAGCIGCVCVDGSKGSAYTGSTNPTGDAFDIDYVAHEMGHQFGGYHTQSNASCRSGDGTTEVEPGSGSTIMGYAGICPANIQGSSDAYFHYVNIRDISANVQAGSAAACAQIIAIDNSPPTANAGPDYTIPKSTPFVLKGSGTDPDGDVLTYTWEQNDPEDPNTTSNAAPSTTKAVGPMFRSRMGTTSPERYFPRINDVVVNNLKPTWEVIPSVGRVLNFALTVRDNKAGGGQTSDDLMRVTVTAAAGPFTVSVPNAALTWGVGSTQTVKWNVAGTNAAPVNCQQVNILLSTDGGFTYPITLASNTPNDGAHVVTIPNVSSSSCRIKVEAAANIFYDISNVNFSIGGSDSCTATVPTGLAATAVTATSAKITWSTVSGATYNLRYRVAGTTQWATVSPTTPSATLNNLISQTTYEAQVRSRCANGTMSVFGPTLKFMTAQNQLLYCASSGNSVADEYIGRVQLGMIDNNSGSNAGYGDFKMLSADLAKGSSYTLIVSPIWTSTAYEEGYAAWIDYNNNGSFADEGEQIWSQLPTKATTVSTSLNIPLSAITGSTRLRVAMKYNGIPTPCENFSHGEVEDYTINLTSPVTECSNVTLTLKFDNYPEETSWSIKNSSGTIVASGGPYTTASDGSTTTSVTCLPVGCYTFTMMDSYSDGMCCASGSGSYSLKNANGVTLASGSTFSASQAHNICINSTSRSGRGENPLAEISQDSYIYPNPVRENLSLHVNPEHVVQSIKIYGSSGMLLKDAGAADREINVAPLPSGIYLLFIETEKGVIRKKFVKE